MAAKSKKRLSKIENKLLRLDKLELNDVICSICQSILIEPVTLPCFHDFCQNCFNGSIENNALCCPLCRLRIGSWLRTATKRRNLVNAELWNHIQTNFTEEVNTKTSGGDVILPAEFLTKSTLRLSAPGEIRNEYEAELKRLREERLNLEQKHFKETELLIQKIQQEEEEAHKKYLEALKKDELIALQMQKEHVNPTATQTSRRLSLRSCTKPRLKDTKIDSYLSKFKTQPQESPLITDDNTNSTNDSTPKPLIQYVKQANSPEMIPSYGKIIKNLIEKKNKYLPGLWNKENGDKSKEQKEDPKTVNKQRRLSTTNTEEKQKTKKKSNIPSLLVSLPLPNTSILQHKCNFAENRKETGSADSMRQELCYFKPIEEITTTCFSSGKGLPLRVPVVRKTPEPGSPSYEPPPSRSQYLEGLCRLRNTSLAKKLPSAFVIALNVLKTNIDSNKEETNNKSKVKKRSSTSPNPVPSVPVRKNPARNKQMTQVNNSKNLRRTRSMGSITKDENETTPKKAKVKERKAASDRKPYLRSDSKKSTKKASESPSEYPETLNNNKVNLAVKDLSSSLKNCDMKHILHEQLRIEKLIEQEKEDLEFARKLEAEWNGRRPTRAAVKRQVSLSHALKPAKKIKV